MKSFLTTSVTEKYIYLPTSQVQKSNDCIVLSYVNPCFELFVSLTWTACGDDVIMIKPLFVGPLREKRQLNTGKIKQ